MYSLENVRALHTKCFICHGLLDNVVPLIVALYRLVRHLTNARAIRRLRRAAVRRVTRGRALDVNRRGEAALLARLADARFEPTIARRRESEADAAVVQQLQAGSLDCSPWLFPVGP